MIADLKPYTTYKDSGLSSLGQVPGHWDVLPLAGLARPKSVVKQSDRQLLSVYLQRGVVKFADVAEKRTNPTSDDLSKYQAVDPGDFVLNNQQAWRGSVGVSTYTGIVSPAYLVLSLSKRHSAPYANLLFRDQSMVAQYLVCSRGVGTIQRNLYWPYLKRVGVVVPPPDEQAAVVRFLDWANGRLERAIRAKRRVIALLGEQKQAIIHHAVTRGLDPSVPLKPSGIPWLGDIPQHWEGRKISTICSLTVDGTHFSPRNDTAGAYLYITAKNIKEHGVDVSSATYVSASAHREIYQRCPVRKGDVLYIKDGATAGLATVNNLEDEFSMLSSVALLRPLQAVATPNFLALALNDCVFKQHALSRVVGGAMTRFTIALLKRFSILIPPLAEQERIVRAVSDVVRPLRATQAKLEREIELLREYRVRLVADIVTGKLDVREAAARLPDEAAPDAAEDDTDLSLDPEAADEEAVV